MIREIKGNKKGLLTKAVNSENKDFIIKDLSYKDISRGKYSEILDHPSYLEVIDYGGKGVDTIDYVFLQNKNTKSKYIWIETDRGTVAYNIID